MALLYALHDLDIPLEVFHFDHQTREGASTEDATFVRAEAARLGLPFHLARRPVAEEAKARGLTFEEYARTVRYEHLLRTARDRGCAVVATGHHADDQAETVLMRVIRGTGPQGIGGIPPVRTEAGIRIVRPLIRVTRAEIRDWLKERGIAFRTDASNDDPVFLRNRVRRDLLPRIEAEYNSRFRAALLRLSDMSRVENDLLHGLAEEFLAECLRDNRIDRGRFARGHRALQRRGLAILAWRAGVEPAFDRIDGAVDFVVSGAAGLAYDLGGGLLLRNGRDRTDVGRTPAPSECDEIVLAAPGETPAFSRRFRVRYLEARPADDLRRYCRPDRQVFDADALDEPLTLRRWKPGDRFTPLGMEGTRKLQDYFTDLGLTAQEKAEQPLLVAGRRIAWVVGRAIDARAAVTPRTQRLVEVEVLDAAQ